jgi:hypothetical protein
MLNFVPIYKKLPQVLQRTDIGNIIRTLSYLSGARLAFFNKEGSKSGG